MQRRALIMLLIALGLGLLTVFLVSAFLRGEGEGRTLRLRTVPVVVAATDLKPGTKLEAVMLRQVNLPASGLPDGHYTDPRAVLGSSPPVVLREIRRGELLLAYKLSPQGARGGLPTRIHEDKRAITVPVTEITGVAGFVTPGDFVDVLYTSSVGRPDNIAATRVLLQNIPVLGVDQVMSQDSGNPKVVNAVTLMVDVESGEMLTLALATGSLTLMLRNEFDASLLETAPVTWRELGDAAIAVPAAEPRQPRVIKRERRQVVQPDAPPVAAAPPQVEVVRGLQVSKQAVPGADAKAAPAGGN